MVPFSFANQTLAVNDTVDFVVFSRGFQSSDGTELAATITPLLPDDDGDGIPNGADQCPGTPAGQPANANCALSQLSFVLTVALQGPPLGRVTSDQAGTACGTDCSETYPGGTQVTLRAATRRGAGFAGFSGGGGCNGPDPCVVTLAADTTVTATFSPPPDRPAITLPLEDEVTIAAGGVLPITWTPTPGAAQHRLEFAGRNLPFTNPGGASPDGVNGFGGAGGGFPLGTGTSGNLAVPPGTGATGSASSASRRPHLRRGQAVTGWRPPREQP